MLTDLFFNRYSGKILCKRFEEKDRRLLAQIFRIIEEQICPYWTGGKENSGAKIFWSRLESSLSAELGLDHLSDEWIMIPNLLSGSAGQSMRQFTPNFICKNWMVSTPDGSTNVDIFVKERLSLAELAFRMRSADIVIQNYNDLHPNEGNLAFRELINGLLPEPPSPVQLIDARNNSFNLAVSEMNERLKAALYPVHYHNGYIQVSTDVLVRLEIEAPFWEIVSAEDFSSVDCDMKEALDLRDANRGYPAFLAARALESAIKIVAEKLGAKRGSETGAHAFIDSLRISKIISVWETDILKTFFSTVRNPLGHGPGSAKPLLLSDTQTQWAIEFCMSWIKSLINRL